MFLGAARDRQMILLPPGGAEVPGCFRTVHAGAERRHRLIEDLQRLRGAVYLAEGAVEPWQLDATGRHIRAADRDSWHLLALDRGGAVLGCSRLRPHRGRVRFEDLEVTHSALAQSEAWGGKLRDAVELEMARASRRGLGYGELGGWALADSIRGGTEALRMALSMYALTQLLGGFLCLSAATRRNGSASILRRIGGSPLVARGKEIPAYYDPQYRCEMELLRFDSGQPHRRYAEWIEACRRVLEQTPVLPASEPAQPWRPDAGSALFPVWQPGKR